MFKSARLKLTLWYFVTIFFVLAVFSILIYQAGSMLLFENISRIHLRLRAQEAGIDMPPRLPRSVNDIDFNATGIESDEFFNDLDSAKSELLVRLLLIDAGVLAVSTFLAYILSGKTLQPIEEALLAQKRFTADAAHELRTPLTSIKTALEVNLNDKKLNKTQAVTVLADNLKDINDLEKLSNDLLTLSRVEHNHQEIRHDNLAMDELLSDLINKFSVLAKVKKIKLVGKAEHELFKGDEAKLKQILSILVDNAIKYTKADGKVSLSFYKEKNKVVFEVKDSGIGIDENDLLHIFDRFYKAESSRNKTRSAGFGLGLSIAKELSKSIKANLEAESKLGKGSTFRLSLC